MINATVFGNWVLWSSKAYLNCSQLQVHECPSEPLNKQFKLNWNFVSFKLNLWSEFNLTWKNWFIDLYKLGTDLSANSTLNLINSTLLLPQCTKIIHYIGFNCSIQ